MRRFNQFLVGLVILGLVVLPLVGCVSKAEYQALQAEQASLVAKSDNLTAELGTVRSDLEKAKTDYDGLNNEYKVLKSDYGKLQTDYDTLNSRYDSANREATSAKAELSQIKKVYPPRDFASRTALQDWLRQNPLSGYPTTTQVSVAYGRALEIQDAALKDGYLISASIYYRADTMEWYVGCLANIDGSVWAWAPSSDEPVQLQWTPRRVE